MKVFGVLLKWKVWNVIAIRNRFGFRTLMTFENGQSIQQKNGFKNLQEAELARLKTISELERQIYISDTTCLTAEYMEFWLESIKRPYLSCDSYNSYKNCVYNYIIPQVGNIRMSSLNRRHIAALYKNVMEKSISVAELMKVVIHTSMEYAVGHHYLLQDPSEGIQLHRPIQKLASTSPKDVLSLAEVCALLKVSEGTALFLPLLLAALMGLRRSEIIGLKYSDIDYKRKTLHVQRQLGSDPKKDKRELAFGTKTKQEIKTKTPSGNRILTIPEVVYEEIMKERILYEQRKQQNGEFKDMNFICCSSSGNPRSRGCFYNLFKKMLQKAALPNVRWHSLRHTYTTILEKSDLEKWSIGRSLGHSRPLLAMDVYTDKKQLIEGIDISYLERMMEKVPKAEL